MIACACREIIMGMHSNLGSGALDLPQLISRRPALR
jgi:hypothetical protein